MGHTNDTTPSDERCTTRGSDGAEKSSQPQKFLTGSNPQTRKQKRNRRSNSRQIRKQPSLQRFEPNRTETQIEHPSTMSPASNTSKEALPSPPPPEHAVSEAAEIASGSTLRSEAPVFVPSLCASAAVPQIDGRDCL